MTKYEEIRLVDGKRAPLASAGKTAVYGIHETPFGFCFIAKSEQGIIAVDFRDNEREMLGVFNALAARWPHLAFTQDKTATAGLAQTLCAKGQAASLKGLPLHLKGTPFQLRVWEALLTIPEGKTSDYSRIALQLGNPKGTRAVGGANGRNPVAFLVPCHRVLAKGGGLGGYATGLRRKEKMLAFEAALQNAASE